MKKKLCCFVTFVAILLGLIGQQSLRRTNVSNLFLDGVLALAGDTEYNPDYSIPYPTSCQIEVDYQEEPITFHGQGCSNTDKYQSEICVLIECH